MTSDEAREKAYAQGLDLVEVAPEARPPVCKIMDYGKYRYEQSKKEREARKKQTIIQIKEIKMRPKTEEHDFRFKLRHAERFLKEGNKAKVTMMFRGREMVHMNLGQKLLDRFADGLKDLAVIEQKAKVEGRSMSMILAPKRGAGQALVQAREG
jgi:translation initiation factor IF-3